MSYTHSNQKVVGSSRAENHLSRAAFRDVFELNKHSQLPANCLYDISKVFTVMTMKYYVRGSAVAHGSDNEIFLIEKDYISAILQKQREW